MLQEPALVALSPRSSTTQAIGRSDQHNEVITDHDRLGDSGVSQEAGSISPGLITPHQT